MLGEDAGGRAAEGRLDDVENVLGTRDNWWCAGVPVGR
jgi:hypothetical protein